MTSSSTPLTNIPKGFEKHGALWSTAKSAFRIVVPDAKVSGHPLKAVQGAQHCKKMWTSALR